MYGEDGAELAPVLHSYGRALLEHAISVSGALGHGGTGGDAEPDEPATNLKKSAMFDFGGDGHEGEDEGQGEPSTGKRKATNNDEDKEKTHEEEEEEEEDDDMGVAFTVLDLSRVILEHILDGTNAQECASSKGKSVAQPKLNLITGETWEKREIEAELAEVRNDLGDIGLETGALSFIDVLQKTLSRHLSITKLH